MMSPRATDKHAKRNDSEKSRRGADSEKSHSLEAGLFSST